MSKQFSILHLALLSAPAATLPWWDPVEEPGGLTCDFRPQQQLKIGEDREEVCMELGQAICRDNGDPLEFWQFGILDPDEKLVLLDPNGKTVYKDLPGATALCFGEDDYGGFHYGGAFPFQPSPPQPYLYVFDDCNQEILAELICHDIPDENREEPTTLKMTDNTDIGDNLYDPVNMVKFRKGRTEDRTDDNLLWGIDVDFKNHPLDGQIVTNNEFCEWKEYYSSARCASNNCGLVDCCDVYEDDTYVFPFCEGSDFCEDLLSTTVIDRVEITLDGICEDLGINEAGTYDLSDTRIFSSKTSLNRALKNFFDAVNECEEGSPNECVSNEQPARGQSQSSSSLPRLDTSFTEIFEFIQEEDCFPSNTNTRRRLARRQKSKGRFNRARRGNNRRRRRRTRRRSRVLTEMLTKNKMLRRALSENKCPPSLGGFYKAEGFTSVNDGTSDADPIVVVQISDPVDCSNPLSDVCTGADGAFSCCGINNCDCGPVIDSGRCDLLGCDISTSCCTEFPDVCGSSSFCTSLTPAPTPAPTPQPTPLIDLCINVTCPSNYTCILGQCAIPLAVNWTTLETSGGGAWEVTNQGLTIRFDIEDSLNCNGANDNVQTASAVAEISLAEPYNLEAVIVGIAELEATGFENMEVYVDETLTTTATSPGGSQGCAMGPVVVTEVVPQPFMLDIGDHQFRLEFTTSDALYHVDAFYEVNLVFTDQT